MRILAEANYTAVHQIFVNNVFAPYDRSFFVYKIFEKTIRP